MVAAVYLPIWVVPTIAFFAIQGYLVWGDARGRRRRRRERDRIRRRRTVG